jgi:CRISPR-associated protein Cas5t
MLGIRVTVPIACFRKGLAREYLETEPLPPPATCYGFLLSLVGEVHRAQHIGCRIAPVLLNRPEQSVVLRTVWRVKKAPLGSVGNTRPDYQQLLSPVDALMWLESGDEEGNNRLEDRARLALQRPKEINRFGGLSLGESTHLVDSVKEFTPSSESRGRVFLLAERGRLTLPVWVDHVGSTGTNYVTGDLEEHALTAPDPKRMPRILPKETSK